MQRSLRCTHVVAGLHPDAGGPSRTVVNLTDSLANSKDMSVTLVSQGFARDPAILPSSKVNRVFLELHSKIDLRFGLTMKRELNHLFNDQYPDLIHSHGLWLPVNHWVSAAARRFGIPIIIHPRGMLESWALSHKFWKKNIALSLFQKSDLESASLFVATSEMEYESIRKFGLKQPVAIIPNGVDFEPSNEAFINTQQSNLLSNERIVLFISRVHPKKGLLNLIRAWARLSPTGWRLKIAGPNEEGHLNEVLALAEQLKIRNKVDYLGSIDGDLKSHVYSSADVFVLPSFSENFGVVVAEALAHGLPVITTKATPWADLERYSCGWWIDAGVDPLFFALEKAIALTDDERRIMGTRGQEYVQRYNWGAIARQTIDAYRWTLGQIAKPDCIEI